jgi:ribosomal protein S4
LGFQRQLHAQRGFVTHHAVAVAVVVVVDLYYIITEEEEEEVSDREEEEEEEEENDKREKGEVKWIKEVFIPHVGFFRRDAHYARPRIQDVVKSSRDTRTVIRTEKY